MTIKLNNDYAVYTAKREILYSGTYQECLEFIEKEESDDVFVDIDKTQQEYELEDLPINYTFVD